MDEEITLAQLLAGRDARAAFQRTLCARYGETLCSFTVNMPGPVKRCARSAAIHEAGTAAIRDALAGHVVYWKLRDPVSGPEGFFVCDLPAQEVKARMCALEQRHPLGRLLDIDVLASDGTPVSRSALGLPPRKCLVCGRDAVLCARGRTHPLPELLARVDELLASCERK